MQLEDGSYTLKYHFVTDVRTGERVLPPGKRLDQGSVLYTPDHAGHLVCAECEVAKIKLQKGFGQAGKRVPIRDHFKVAHGEKHHPDCLKLTDQIDDVDSDHEWDLNKGPVIFLNELPEPPIASRAFYRTAHPQPKLIVREEDGKLRITNEDLDNRRRLRAKTPEDLFRIMKSKSLNQRLLQDAWIINSDHATPFPRFFIRPEANGEQDRMKLLTADLILGQGREHAVMLNTTLHAPPSHKSKDGKTHLRFPLEPFTMFHPETGREIQVVPHLHVRDKMVFHDFNGVGRSKGRGPAEIFVLAHPYISRLRTNPDTVFLHFEVNQGAHYAWQTLSDLTRAVTKRPEFRQPEAV